MKTELRKIETRDTLLEVTDPRCFESIFDERTVTVTFTLNRIPDCSPEDLELHGNFRIPDTLREFREDNNISKEELVEWLNENYK